MEVNVLNVSGKETGATVQLSDSIFGIEPNDHAIYLDVKQYLANQRQGTHKAKQRNRCLMVVAVYSVRSRAITASS
jgi:large subunit ribosomal protein L4